MAAIRRFAMKVAVLGASNKPDRYSHKALVLLREKGHTPFPVHPTLREIEGVTVAASLRDLPGPVDVVTLYLGPAHQANIADQLVASRPKRVIFNPGTENPALAERLQAAGIEALNACTLVLLRTGQFEG